MLVAVGLDCRGVSPAPRDLLAPPCDGADAVLEELAALEGVDEVAFLHTRRRAEALAAARFPSLAATALRHAIEGITGEGLRAFELQGEAAFRHLVRVAASLDSSALAEPHAAALVKGALERARERGVAGGELTRLVGAALRSAARVRIEAPIGREEPWGDAAAALAEKVLGPLPGRRVAVIGTGETASACARHLAGLGAAIAVLGDVGGGAAPLAARVGGMARPLEALGDELLRADVVVAAAPLPREALGPGALARAARVRRRPLVLVDLAAPRAIPTESGRVPDVFLCNEDDLDRVLRASLAEREQELAEAERIVDEEVARWLHAEATGREGGGAALAAAATPAKEPAPAGAARRGDAR